MRKLDIYFMALSIAGVKRVEPPPAGNSADYVAILYDILVKCKTRAETLLLKLYLINVPWRFCPSSTLKRGQFGAPGSELKTPLWVRLSRR